MCITSALSPNSSTTQNKSSTPREKKNSILQKSYKVFIVSNLKQILFISYYSSIKYTIVYLENSEKDENTRPPGLALEKPVCWSGSNS